MNSKHLGVISFAMLVIAASGQLAAADVVTTSPSNATMTLWDQPNGVGHSITFTGTGAANLGSFLVDPANPGLGTWDHAVRSYKATDTIGILRKTVGASRSEQFGPNFNIKNAGIFGQAASQLIISWVGWNQPIQSGSIVAWGAASIPGADLGTAFCMDTLPGHVDDFATPLIIMTPCSFESAPSQQWHFDNGLLRNIGTGLCMDTRGQLNGVFNTFVVKPCSSDPNEQQEFQTFSFDTQRHRWRALGVNVLDSLGNVVPASIRIFNGFPPSFGFTLVADEPSDDTTIVDDTTLWLNYFF